MNELMARRTALIAIASAAILGCGGGTQPSREVAPAATPGAARPPAATQAITDYPRPPKPSRQYRSGLSIDWSLQRPQLGFEA